MERKLSVWPLIFKCRDIPPSHCLMLLFGIFQASERGPLLLAEYYCHLFATARQFWWGHLASHPPITATGKPGVLFVNNPHNVKPQIEFQDEKLHTTGFESVYLQSWWQLDVGSGGFIRRRNSNAAFSPGDKNLRTLPPHFHLFWQQYKWWKFTFLLAWSSSSSMSDIRAEVGC